MCLLGLSRRSVMAKALEWEIQPDEAEFSPFSSSGRAVKATLTAGLRQERGLCPSRKR